MVAVQNAHPRHAPTPSQIGALRLAIALAIALFAQAASAAPCSFVSVGPMIFTGYTPFGGAGVATASVTVSCGNSPQPSIAVATTPRSLTATGLPALPFELYPDAAHSAPWQANQKVSFTATAGGQTTVTLVFGGITAGQDVAAATYTTTVTVNLYHATNPNPVDTAQMTVQATIAPACVVGSGTLAFGTYDPIGANATAPLDAQGTLGVSCTRNTAYTVGLGLGANATGTTRNMANGAGRLTYELYRDPGRATVWTPTVTLAGTAASTGTVQLPVYGRLPAGQAVSVGGAYQDTVVATVTF